MPSVAQRTNGDCVVQQKLNRRRGENSGGEHVHINGCALVRLEPVTAQWREELTIRLNKEAAFCPRKWSICSLCNRAECSKSAFLYTFISY